MCFLDIVNGERAAPRYGAIDVGGRGALPAARRYLRIRRLVLPAISTACTSSQLLSPVMSESPVTVRTG